MILNKQIDNNHLCVTSNVYIVDTNVLLYTFNENFYNNDDEMKKMCNLLNQALDIGCKVYVPLIVISEYVSVCHKKYFEKKRNRSEKKLDYKKDYRKTKEFENNNKLLYKTIKEVIFDRIRPINDDFSSLNIDEVFNLSNADFNDEIIMSIANKNNAYLISADRDTKIIPGLKKICRRKK